MSQIAEINPAQVGLILKVNKQVSWVNRVWGGWLEKHLSLELAFNKLIGVSKVKVKMSREENVSSKSPASSMLQKDQ